MLRRELGTCEYRSAIIGMCPEDEDRNSTVGTVEV
jgi:hypothetical protein